MKDILDKLSSYNIFNYLLPGTIFVFVLKKFTGFDLIQSDTLIGGFLYYFIGMIISRCGSVFIEPFLQWTKFVKFEEYKDYIRHLS
jgi:predicted membrane channel-forming protein YqfA (hemolysin III family)